MNKNQLINLRKKVMKILIGLEEKKNRIFNWKIRGDGYEAEKKKE